jgi:putative hemolysin
MLRKTKIFLLAFFLLMSTSIVEASESDFFISFLDGVKTHFRLDEKQQWTISSDCFKNGKALDCQAFRALSSVAQYKRDPRLGVVEEYESLCEKTQGRLVVGTNEDQSEVQICIYNDHSMIATNSLFAHLKR